MHRERAGWPYLVWRNAHLTILFVGPLMCPVPFPGFPQNEWIGKNRTPPSWLHGSAKNMLPFHKIQRRWAHLQMNRAPTDCCPVILSNNRSFLVSQPNYANLSKPPYCSQRSHLINIIEDDTNLGCQWCRYLCFLSETCIFLFSKKNKTFPSLCRRWNIAIVTKSAKSQRLPLHWTHREVQPSPPINTFEGRQPPHLRKKTHCSRDAPRILHTLGRWV